MAPFSELVSREDNSRRVLDQMNATTSLQPLFWQSHPYSVKRGSKFLKGIPVAPTVPLHELHDQLCFVLPSLSDSTHTCHEQPQPQPQPQVSITLLQIVHTFLPRRTIRIGGACRLASGGARPRVLLSDHADRVTFRIRWTRPCFPERPELGAAGGASSELGGDVAQVRWDAQFVRETIDKA